jgi:hypothetical protein
MEHLGVYDRIILKQILTKYDRNVWNGSVGLMTETREHGNKHSFNKMQVIS